MTKLKKVKIPADKWVQIGGDTDITDRVVLAKYNEQFEQIHVIEITREDDENYHGHESEYEIDDLKEKDIEEFGLESTGNIEGEWGGLGLELIAEEILTSQGGDPINCDGQADYRSKFKSFKKALQCAIGDAKFTDFSKKEVSIDDL